MQRLLADNDVVYLSKQVGGTTSFNLGHKFSVLEIRAGKSPKLPFT